MKSIIISIALLTSSFANSAHFSPFNVFAINEQVTVCDTAFFLPGEADAADYLISMNDGLDNNESCTYRGVIVAQIRPFQYRVKAEIRIVEFFFPADGQVVFEISTQPRQADLYSEAIGKN